MPSELRPASAADAAAARGASLADRLGDRTAHVAVVGQGYVGLPLAVAFAQAGFRVSGLDVDVERVHALNLGQSHSPDVDAGAVPALIAAGRYAATADFAVLSEADAVVICVPTPLRKSKEPDISFLLAAARRVAEAARPDQLLVLESTTYPGTTEELLLPLLEARGLVAGASVYVAFSPERLDPGNPHFKIREVPKLVGGVTPRCTAMAALLYRQIVSRVVEVANPRVAELAKLYENTFRAVNIGLANELALMCRHLGVSVWDVIDAAATKPFGFMPFTPGPGIGGHCIPVDPLYLSWKARLSGYEARFIALADAVNGAMPGVVVGLIADALNTRGRALKGSRVLVLGVAYKPGIGDVRDCPAVEIIHELRGKGAEIRYADPHVPRLALPGHALEASKLTPELLRWSDAAVIVTDHAEFDYAAVVAEAALVVDTRNATRALGDAPGIVRL